jgi:phage-related protein
MQLLLSFSAAWQLIKKLIMYSPIGIIIKLWKPIVGFFKAIFGLVWVIIKAAIAAIIWVLKNFTPVGLIFKYWDKIVAFFKGIWDAVKKPFLDIVDWVFNLGKSFLMQVKISLCQ